MEFSSDMFSDIFLGGAAIAAAIYCLVLSRKLSRLRGLDQDLGGAIAILSQQVDEMTHALENAQKSADASSTELSDVAGRAEAASSKLEMLISSLHDLPEIGAKTSPQPVAEVTPAAATPIAESVAEPQPEQPLFLRRARVAGGGG